MIKTKKYINLSIAKLKVGLLFMYIYEMQYELRKGMT